MFKNLFDKLLRREDLAVEEMEFAMTQIMSGEISDIKISGFLSALRVKGETEDEILGAAKVMREKSLKINLPFSTMDTCGTGGDGHNTYNISSLVAIILAAGGVKILKHGNRAVSSSCGSADIFESLGVEINLKPSEIEDLVSNVGIGFIFAPNYHTSMKHVMKARRELGVRTIFNILGPLSNPGFSKYQIMGVYDKNIMEKVAKALICLGLKNGMIIHGKDRMDEVTLTDITYAIEIRNGNMKKFEIDPREYGFKLCKKEDLAGGNVELNKSIFYDVLNNKKGPRRDIALLNSGVAFYIYGISESIKEGIDRADEIVESGKALEKLQEFINESRKYNVS